MPVSQAGVTLRLATDADIEAIARLREETGWHAFEWALRDAMRPPSARCLVALSETYPTAVIGVGSGIAYGRLGVVGNMVVAPDHRRLGIGTEILERLLAFLDERGCTQVELYATAEGRPLYARHGFGPAGSSALARIGRGAIPSPSRTAIPASADDLAAIATYDAERFGGDRSPILRAALDDPQRPTFVVRGQGALSGYAVVREDGRIGPWLADDLEAAAALLSAAAAVDPDLEQLTTNIPMDNVAGVAWLRGLGASIEPWDGRMRRGSGVQARQAAIFGNVIGALG